MVDLLLSLLLSLLSVMGVVTVRDVEYVDDGLLLSPVVDVDLCWPCLCAWVALAIMVAVYSWWWFWVVGAV